MTDEPARHGASSTGHSAASDAAASEDEQVLVQQAARALAKAGLVHAYGHCSARIAPDRFLVCAAMPMGLIASEPGAVVRTTGTLPDGVLGEVRGHQAIYRLRPDVGGICRIMPPALMALSTRRIVPRPRHGIGAYFDDLRLWDDPRLLRDEASADAMAQSLGDACAIVLRGNGAFVAADTLPRAVTLAWFLEDAARVEASVRAAFDDPEEGLLTPDEISARKVFAGGVVERMWDFLTRS